MPALGAILLGLINVAIVVAVLLLIGYIVILIFSGLLNIAIPENIRRIYIIIVALIALYLIVQLLLGVPFNIIGRHSGMLLSGYG